MLNDFRIDVGDLKRFSQELQSLGTEEFKRGIRPVLLKFARGVVPVVQSRYDSHYPSVSGTGRASIRAGAGIDRASITIGSARAPYMIGQEFGSDRYSQFRPWTGKGERGKGSRGRFLYPTLRSELPDLTGELMDALMDVAGRAFPERVL